MYTLIDKIKYWASTNKIRKISFSNKTLLSFAISGSRVEHNTINFNFKELNSNWLLFSQVDLNC